MKKLFQYISFLFGLFIFIMSGINSTQANEAPRPEVRALWVDAFRDGIKTPAQVDRLIQDAVRGNINTLIVQIRRRGDAYYNKTMEPRTEDPVLSPGFDALQDLIEKAHAQKIEVHAWLNTLVAWNRTTPPKDPNHIWNLHGPAAKGRANWVSYSRSYDKATQRWSETLNQSYFLDPGHPDVVDYTANVYLHVVKNYDVDGIHLDYSRYAGQAWGYNPTSLERFNSQYETTGVPDPADPRWLAWRREQTAHLARKIYLKAIALKPMLKVSSAVITWGDGPEGADGWEQSRAYRDVCQDWRGWLQEGIIDLAIPMNYFPEWGAKHPTWYNRWIEWEKDNQYGRQIVIGPGILSQYIEGSLDQIRRAQTPSALGNRAAGVCLFAYGASHLYSCDDYKDSGSGKGFPRQPYIFLPETNGWLYQLLSQEGGYTDPILKTFIRTQPVFPSPATIPDMPWKSRPTKGYLMGQITPADGASYDRLKVSVEVTLSDGSIIRREAATDGSGWFGLAELPPGKYRITIDHKSFAGEKKREVVIQSGKVSEANFRSLP